MRQKLLFALPLLTFMMFLHSCSSIKVITDYDPNVSFDRYKTYAFYKAGIDQVKISDLDKRRILKSLENTLREKGFSASEQPDILLNFFTKEEAQVDIYNNAGLGWGWGWNPWFWPGMGMQNTQVTTRAKGRLFIDIIDAKSKRLLWQGSGVGFLEPQDDPLKKQANIQKFVHEIMAAYPPSLEKK